MLRITTAPLQVLPSQDEQPAAVRFTFGVDLLPACGGYQHGDTLHVFAFARSGDLFWLKVGLLEQMRDLNHIRRSTLEVVPLQDVLANKADGGSRQSHRALPRVRALRANAPRPCLMRPHRQTMTALRIARSYFRAACSARDGPGALQRVPCSRHFQPRAPRPGAPSH